MLLLVTGQLNNYSKTHFYNAPQRNFMCKIMCVAKRERGFTLIEILIVLLIISISISFAVLKLGNTSERRLANNYAEHIQNYILSMREQAILNNCELEILISERSISVQDSANALFPSQKRGISIPKNLTISPKIVINIASTGRISAFTLYLGTSKVPRLVQLIGKVNGPIIIK